MSKKLALLLASSSFLSLAACTALLGSFEVDPNAGNGTDGGPGPGADAAGDGMTNGETGGGDAAVDGGADAAPPPLLKCSISDPNPRHLDMGPITQDLAAYSISATQTRVIAGIYGQGVSIYTYDRNGGGGGNPTITPLTNVGRILQIRRLPNAIGILSIDQAPPGATSDSIGVWVIDDATGTGARTAFRLVTQTNQFSGAFAPLAGGDYLFAYSDGAGTINAARYIAGGGSPSPVTIASGLTSGSSVSALEVSNGKAYIFNNVNPGEGGSGGYYVVDTSLAMLGGALNSLAGTAGKTAFALTADPTANKFQAAVVELDLVNGMPPAVLHAGPVPAAKATTFNVLDLPAATTFNSILDAPFGDHTSAQFEGDNFIALGPNPNKDPGLNFIWFDTKQKALRALNGNMDKLLPMRATTSVAAVLTQSTAIFANFDIVWTQDASNFGSPTLPATLYAAQMSCIK
jgi:hypothetical protein